MKSDLMLRGDLHAPRAARMALDDLVTTSTGGCWPTCAWWSPRWSPRSSAAAAGPRWPYGSRSSHPPTCAARWRGRRPVAGSASLAERGGADPGRADHPLGPGPPPAPDVVRDRRGGERPSPGSAARLRRLIGRGLGLLLARGRTLEVALGALGRLAWPRPAPARPPPAPDRAWQRRLRRPSALLAGGASARPPGPALLLRRGASGPRPRPPARHLPARWPRGRSSAGRPRTARGPRRPAPPRAGSGARARWRQRSAPGPNRAASAVIASSAEATAARSRSRALSMASRSAVAGHQAFRGLAQLAAGLEQLVPQLLAVGGELVHRPRRAAGLLQRLDGVGRGPSPSARSCLASASRRATKPSKSPR